MTTHRAINWGLALIISVLLGSLYRLDGPTDHNIEMAQAADLQAAIQAEAAEARFAKAAAALCGPNAGYALLPDGAMQCYTHKGRKTVKVSL